MSCKICGKALTEHFCRCEEHYRCDICGTKESLCYRNDGLTCEGCHAEIARKQVEAFTGDTDYKSEITCPWCGHEKMDSWEASDEDDNECGFCGNEYKHTREIEVTYSSIKIESR